MITLSARISPAKDASVLFLSGESYVGNTNVSTELNNVINKKSSGDNVFLLGLTKFKERGTYVDDKVDYYIGDIFSDSNGSFSSIYEFSLKTTADASFVVIYFDTFNNEYPPTVIVDYNTTYYLNSPTLCLKIDGYETHSISIPNWNKPNRPLVINGVQTFVDVNNRNLISIDFSGQDRSDTSLPSFGIKSNSGYLEMFDTDGIIESMRNLGVLSNSAINIYLNAKDRQDQIGGFYISNIDKNRQTLKTKIDFQDILLSWENIEIRSYPLNEFLEGISSYDFINKILEENDITMVHSRDGERYIPYPYIEGGSAWAVLTKFCELTGSYICCDKIGMPTMHYNGGR